MTAVPAPSVSETERLARLRALFVLDSAPEPVFDGLARMASEICRTPIALVSLVDAERLWLKANVGLPGVAQTPRDVAFCAHTIGSDAVMEVSDTRDDPRFADNPFVTGEPGIRFYAGAPLVLPDGARVGALCVIDHQTRQLDAGQRQMLRSLADLASQALVMRRELLEQASTVRSRYEQALAESEANYRAIVEAQGELVSVAQPDGRLVYANPAYARQVGRDAVQLVGASLLDFIDPGDRAALRAQLDEVLASGTNCTGESRMAATDGGTRWVAWSHGLQRDAARQPLLHSVGRDITDRKSAELALRASQSFLSRTGRIASVGGWQIELANNTISWSGETQRIHEVGPDFQPTIENAMTFYAPEALGPLGLAVQAAIEHGTPWDMELPFITATGRAIWVRSISETEFEDGRAVRLVGAFQDITERKQLEQRVADSERFAGQIADNLPIRIAYVDRELRYRFINQAHCDRLNMTREQILGRTRAELMGRPNEALLELQLEAVFAGHPQHCEYDEVVHGSVRRIEGELVPDFDEAGQVRGFFATGADVTERANAERALRELTAIVKTTTDFVVQTDSHGQLTYMNPAARRLTGLAEDEPLTGRQFAEFNTPQTNQLFETTIRRQIEATGVWLGEATVYAKDGREVPVSHMVIAHRDVDGRIDRYSAVMRDISAQVSAKQEMLRQTETLRLVMESMPALVAVIGADQRLRFVNSGAARLLGSTQEAIVGKSLGAFLPTDDYENYRPWVERVLAGHSVTFERTEVAGRGGLCLSISFTPLWLDNGTVDGYVAVAHDITTQKQEEVRLLQLSQQDALTGLLNRSGFEQALQLRLKQGEGATLAMLYIDLDHFKPVNDRHGHPVGDQVLQRFGQRLRALVRPTDAVARLGGDEFAMVLCGVRESAHAQAVADKVLAAAHTPFQVEALTLSIGASVGVAIGADPEAGWAELIARADAMLYRAKNGGRGRQAGADEPPPPGLRLRDAQCLADHQGARHGEQQHQRMQPPRADVDRPAR